MFKYCADQIVRRCVQESEIQNILSFCHEQACGGNFSAKKTATKILQCGFNGQLYFEMLTLSVLHVISVNEWGALHEEHDATKSNFSG